MRPPKPKISIFMVLLAMALVSVPSTEETYPNGTPGNSTRPSPWLRSLSKPPRGGGCRGQPSACRDHDRPFRRMLCCRNQCVDVGFDEHNCGFCGKRCRFSWRCCKGSCVDTNFNPFHCGGCFNRCPPLVPCFHGMCGYALPHPPSPKHPGGHQPPPGGGALSS